ncbi:MAG: leucine--tRNA ligase [Dehalococcoidia bacterium]|nr:leucine--tRNA ligase [Dehalococcoidia bacterium]
MAERFDPQAVEAKWQSRWASDGLYRTVWDPSRPKWYAMTMFPYTSGDLHCGHWYAMAPSDTHARYKRMKGYNVLFPIGFDAFGLPAENAAISRGIHPFRWTMDNAQRMRGQLRSMGAMFDWDREVVTCLPEYYQWNQWLFLQFYKRGLAYRAKAPANWCPGCQTVLANEQVMADGTCERCHSVVTKRDLSQWFFRITNYADELLQFDGIEWPERVQAMQTNWIGRSFGVEVSFGLNAPGVAENEVRVFTTRPDTIYGATFMVLAPEHPLLGALTTPERKAEVEAYMEAARRATEIERQSTEREKSGVFTGAYCLNRFTGKPIPIYTADYVLVHYGTGAVMGVPAHDTRDFAFATKYGLPIVTVVAPPGWRGQPLAEAYIESGPMVNSGPFDGVSNADGKERIADHAETTGWGRRRVTYRLRDWLISRQRYWGTPIPIIYCPTCGEQPVPEDQLPVVLPEDAEFKPTGESPLRYHAGFYNTVCPRCGGAATRETDTMDTFVDSSWYQMRYLSPHYSKGPFDPAEADRWHPVDQYTGGAEHATMHLLYARFFHKVLRDLGLVESNEPYVRLFNQGQILGTDGQRMSKSRGNVVAPDDNVARYGADAFRTYLMFLGPWDQGGPFNTEGINGATRWLNRVWTLVSDHWDAGDADGDPVPVRELRRWTHRTIKRVDHDVADFHFNTMLAALMEFTNYLVRPDSQQLRGTAAWREALESLILMTAPSTPHFAEELWTLTGHPYSVHQQAFPSFDPALTVEDEITLVVQVNGKVREKLAVAAGISEDQAKAAALASPKVAAQIDGRQPRQVIYVPGRLVNIVL